MPRTAADRLAEYVARWAELGVKAWAIGWWELPIAVGDESQLLRLKRWYLIARLCNTSDRDPSRTVGRFHHRASVCPQPPCMPGAEAVPSCLRLTKETGP